MDYNLEPPEPKKSMFYDVFGNSLEIGQELKEIDGMLYYDGDEERFIEWLIKNDPDMIKNIMFDYLFDHATTITIEE